MTNQVYRRTMKMARRAKREGLDLTQVAPPLGRLHDAFMREYERAPGPDVKIDQPINIVPHGTGDS